MNKRSDTGPARPRAASTNSPFDSHGNVTSQSGEDAVLDGLLRILPNPSGWCVEFGAWDGSKHSNTNNLVTHGGYSAVWIEGATDRFRELQGRFRANPRVYPLHAFVGFGPRDNLDILLSQTPIPKRFDVLSIDVDGNDFHIWAAVQEYRASIVVIEYNPTIPTGVRFVQAPDPQLMHGSSIDALVDLGREKGYELVAITKYNCVFVERELFCEVGVDDNSISTLRRDTSFVTYVFCGYDGTVLVDGHGGLPWHGVRYRSSRLQQLPPILREWRGNYGAVRRRLLAWYKRVWNSLA